jgi:hypothetical protein
MVSNISDAEYKSQEIFSRFWGGAVQHHGFNIPLASSASTLDFNSLYRTAAKMFQRA